MVPICNTFPFGFHTFHHSKTGKKDDFLPKPLVYHAGLSRTVIHWGSNIHSYLEEKLYGLRALKQNTKKSLYKKLYKSVVFCLSGSNFSLVECYSISLLVFYVNQNKAILQKSHFASLRSTASSQAKLKQVKIFSFSLNFDLMNRKS